MADSLEEATEEACVQVSKALGRTQCSRSCAFGWWRWWRR